MIRCDTPFPCARPRGAALAVLTVLAPGVQAQDAKDCAVLLLHGKGAAPAAVAPLGKKLQPVCAARAPDMPWSAKRAGDGDGMQEIARHVKELRQQGFKRIVLVGQGLGANAAIAYAGQAGDIEAVVALGGDSAAADWGGLPVLTPRIRQHIPLLWVVGRDDPLHKLGEDYAYAKAPPHPAGRYVQVKADAAGTVDAAAKPLLQWVKDLP